MNCVDDQGQAYTDTLAAGWIYYINDEGWRTPLVFLDESKTKLLAAVERNGRVGLPFRHDGNKIGTLVYPSPLLLPLTFFRWVIIGNKRVYDFHCYYYLSLSLLFC